MTSISVITVAYNVANTLEDCLDSIARQKSDVEHILIDGASTDVTMEIVNKNREKISFFISEPDNGIYDAMNKGLNHATGNIIGILNADDFYPSENILEKVIGTLDNSEIDACYGDLCYVNANNKDKIIRYWRAGEYTPGKFYWGWMPPHPTFFVKKKIYDQYGLFNTRLGTAADYELMLRFLLKHKIRVAYIPKVLVHMRTGGISNATIPNRIKANRMDKLAWQVNGLTPYPWTIYMKPLRKIGQWFV